jgi:hypothetical protein
MALATSPTRLLVGTTETLTDYLVATSNDTTDPANGIAIDNRDGKVSALTSVVYVTDKTGTSPTLQMILQGSNDGGTNWATVKDSAGNAIQTSALDISSADTTAVSGEIDLGVENRTNLPFALLRIQCDLGGTSPGWTGDVNVVVKRAG